MALNVELVIQRSTQVSVELARDTSWGEAPVLAVLIKEPAHDLGFSKSERHRSQLSTMV